LAIRCAAFGMRVIGVSASRTEAPGFDAIMPQAQIAQAAGLADFLVLLLPYTPRSHHLVDATVLAAMQPHAMLINLARGGVVDEPALIAALAEHRIAGAGLDVFEVEPLPQESPLWAMDNVMITPHIGGMSDTYARQVSPLLIDNIVNFAAGRIDAMRNVIR
jgi:D-2-hydroxyacid dehydrogenase (NADP+)